MLLYIVAGPSNLGFGGIESVSRITNTARGQPCLGFSIAPGCALHSRNMSSSPCRAVRCEWFCPTIAAYVDHLTEIRSSNLVDAGRLF